MLAACAQRQIPVQPLPSGATPAEIAEYATAQAHYRLGQATGDRDAVAQSVHTFRQISAEIVSRQDPKLFDARLVCERYRVAGAGVTYGSPSALEQPFVRDCGGVLLRYDAATAAIRNDLEARIAAADRATVAQAGSGHP